MRLASFWLKRSLPSSIDCTVTGAQSTISANSFWVISATDRRIAKQLFLDEAGMFFCLKYIQICMHVNIIKLTPRYACGMYQPIALGYASSELYKAFIWIVIIKSERTVSSGTKCDVIRN